MNLINTSLSSNQTITAEFTYISTDEPIYTKIVKDKVIKLITKNDVLTYTAYTWPISIL